MADADQRVRDAIARGDFRAANELIARDAAPIVLARIRQLVRGTWLAKDAEDLCHEVLIKAFAALRAGKFAGRSTVIGYVLGIAQHTVFHARASWVAKLLGRAADLQALDAAPPPPPRAGRIGADAIDVDALLKLLDERERVIVSLRLEDQRFEAIGRLLRIKPNTANQIYRRALQKLRAHLSEPGDPAAAASSRPAESRP